MRKASAQSKWTIDGFAIANRYSWEFRLGISGKLGASACGGCGGSWAIRNKQHRDLTGTARGGQIASDANQTLD